jgi:predicted deacylase
MQDALASSVGKTILQEGEAFFLYNFKQCQKAFLRAYSAYSGKKTHEFYPLQESPGDKDPSQILGTDTIWLGSLDAKQVLVFISGTHGVEGFCGSAIQQFFLSQLTEDLFPQDTAILMIHSLNPWGMHWARRCDASGIDLNRNFVDYQKVEALDPEYEGILSTLMNSKDRYQEMQNQSEKWGQQTFDRIFSGGQYVHTWAPFFGGQSPAHGRKVIENVIELYDLPSRNTMVIDLHTGLGPWAFGELISDHLSNSHGNQQAKGIFGAAIANAHEGASFSVPKAGLLDYRFHQFMNEKGFFLTLEFGSYGSAALFEVLLIDHVYWRDYEPSSIDEADYQFYRERMIEHFCPKDSIWQQAVLFKAWQVFDCLIQSIKS